MRVFHHKNEVKPILDVEVIEKINEFVDEQVDRPEGWRLFFEVRRFCVAKLIVEDNRNTIFIEISVNWENGKKIVMTKAWACM